MRSRNLWLTVTAVAISLSGSGCAEGSLDDTAACLEEQAEGYPVVEAEVARTLEGLRYASERVDHCEESGRAIATVLTELPEDITRKDASALLTGRGWRLNHETGFFRLESDGSHLAASVTRASSTTNGKPVIEVRFSRGT